MITHYIKVAFRNMWKYKAQSLVGIFGLAFGFVAFVLGLYWFLYELNYDEHYLDADRIFFVNAPKNHQKYSNITTPYPLHIAMKETFPEIEAIDAVQSTMVDAFIAAQANAIMVKGFFAHPDFFDIFPPVFLSGKSFSDAAKEVVLTKNAAMMLFNTSDVTGKTVTILQGYMITDSEYVIAGVVENPPSNSNMQYQILLPYPSLAGEDWSNYAFQTYLKLKENVDAKQFRIKLNNGTIGRDGYSMDVDIVPLNRMKYMADGKSFINAYGFLLIIVIASALLLVSALFNYTMLSTMRILTRIKECAVRRMAGSSKANIAGMFYVEMILVMLITLMLSVLLFVMSDDALSQYTGTEMSGASFYSMLVKSWIGCLVAVLLAGIYPVWRVNRMDMGQSFHTGKGYARKAMLTVQLAIGVMLLCGLMEVDRQFRLMTKSDLGFERENILRFVIPTSIRDQTDPLINKLKSNTSVTDAIWLGYDIFSSQQAFSTRGGNVFSQEKNQEIVYLSPLWADAARFFGLEMVAGNFFEHQQGEPVRVVVNEELVKQMELTDVFGKKIEFDNRNGEVIGIIRDFHTNPMTTQVWPTYYVNPEQFDYWGANNPSRCYVKHLYGQEREVRQSIIDACHSLDANIQTVEIGKFDDYIRTFYHSEEQTIQIFGVISVICLFICLLGIYAMVNLTVQQRRREIAIRKVVGAETPDILRMLLKEYLWLVLIASVVALPPVYLLMNRWLNNYAYHVSIGAECLWVVMVIALMVSLIVLWKSFAAANSDPAEVVKTE